MNERIKELIKQCEDYGSWDNKVYTFDKEKLAELIVREVLAVQEQFIAEGHNAWHLNKPTKQHFGVKE
jgi:hypothetical protein